jgi:hypothetical protein
VGHLKTIAAYWARILTTAAIRSYELATGGSRRFFVSLALALIGLALVYWSLPGEALGDAVNAVVRAVASVAIIFLALVAFWVVVLPPEFDRTARNEGESASTRAEELSKHAADRAASKEFIERLSEAWDRGNALWATKQTGRELPGPWRDSVWAWRSYAMGVCSDQPDRNLFVMLEKWGARDSLEKKWPNHHQVLAHMLKDALDEIAKERDRLTIERALRMRCAMNHAVL